MNALEALKKIRDCVGICGNVELMPYELKELMVEWPGNAAKLRQNYPVEGDGYEADSEAGTPCKNSS